MSMDRPLEKVTSPTFDMARAVSDYREQKAKEKKMMAVVQKLMGLGRSAKVDDRLALLDKAIAENPELEDMLGLQKYTLMFQAKDKGASAYGMKLVDGPIAEDAPRGPRGRSAHPRWPGSRS